MSFISSLKTSPYPSPGSKTAPGRKGAVSFIFAFMIFLFSIFSLSLVVLTHLHLRLSLNRRNLVLIEYSAENGIKQGVGTLLSLLKPYSSPQPLSREEFEKLREMALSSGKMFIEKVLGENIPLCSSETWEHQCWKNEVQLLKKKFVENEHCFRILFEVLIDSEGKIKNFRLRKKAEFSGLTEIFAGNVPLSLFPLIIEKKMSPEEKANFFQKNSIQLSQAINNTFLSPSNFPETQLIPEEISKALALAFKVKIFKPQDLSNSELRFFLGLEVNNDPVPEAVYLIQDNLGLGGIYVEGDVEEIIFALENSYQIIHFKMKSGEWRLKYSPLERRTIFSTPEKEITFDLLPLEIVIISGNVNSLAGGRIDSWGQLKKVEEEIPSLLQDAQLTIIASGKISISSHLLQQGLSQLEGVPYLKENPGGLVLFSTGKDIWKGTPEEGGIEISENSPQEIKIQAEVVASGKGFSIIGEGKNVTLIGSLQSSDYFSSGNSLSLDFKSSGMDFDSTSLFLPLTKEPIIFVSLFSASGWEELE
ncbi:MAG: hypothetical protein ACE5LC_00490 [Candidatus Aminicenantales bacterium]